MLLYVQLFLATLTERKKLLPLTPGVTAARRVKSWRDLSSAMVSKRVDPGGGPPSVYALSRCHLTGGAEKWLTAIGYRNQMSVSCSVAEDMASSDWLWLPDVTSGNRV